MRKYDIYGVCTGVTIREDQPVKKDDLFFWLFISICFAAGLYFNPSAGAREDCVLDSANDVPVIASTSSSPQCTTDVSAR